MKRVLFISSLLLLLLAACGGPATDLQDAGSETVTIYKTPTWGCCTVWSAYLESNGFTVTVVDMEDLTEIKAQYHVPAELQSCHTAIVDGYVVEGHVPADEIKRMLDERPDIVGIGVAGMPPGSPGMDIEGFEDDPYDVVSFDESGVVGVYASYPK